MSKALVTEVLKKKLVATAPSIEDGGVGLVLTGGTIGAFEEDSVLSVGGQAEAESRLVDQLWPDGQAPSLVIRSPLRKLSENFEPDDWLVISAAARDLANADAVAGIVILHGTDTMTYTAAALSFLLVDLDIPVVLTGSNLPSHHPESDALHNVRDALVALDSLQRGVYVAFAGGTDLPSLVHLGTRVRKRHAGEQAFFSVNREPVGTIREGAFQFLRPHVQQVMGGFVNQVDPRVLSVRLYPGLDFEALLAAVRAGDTRAVLIELYASATGPDTEDRFSLPVFVRSCAELGVVVATTVSIPLPRNLTSVYETTLAIEEAGAMFLHDMIPEAAIAKLMWALGQEDDPQRVRDLMLTPIAGEIDGES